MCTGSRAVAAVDWVFSCTSIDRLKLKVKFIKVVEICTSAVGFERGTSGIKNQHSTFATHPVLM